MSKKRTAKKTDAEWERMVLAHLEALGGKMDPEEELMRELDFKAERRRKAMEARLRKLEDLLLKRPQPSAHAEPTKEPRNR